MPRRETARTVAVTLVTVALAFWQSTALAQSIERRFPVSVGETTIAEGLRALQRSTGAKFVFSPEQLRMARTKGVTGDLTISEALDRLLEGSDFEAQVAGGGTYVIVNSPTARIVPRLERAPASENFPMWMPRSRGAT